VHEQPGAAIARKDQPEPPRKPKRKKTIATGGFGAPGW